MYVSKIGKTPVIDSSIDLINAARDLGKVKYGYIPRDWTAQPVVEFCSPLPPDFLIPRVEWPERIKELEAKKATLTDVRRRTRIKTTHQNGWNYCWMFATSNAIRVVRAKAKLPYLDLSPSAAAWQIKGGRNSGGNTFEAIPWVARNGIPTTRTWPMNAGDRKYVTDEMKVDAQQTILKEWWELPRNNFDLAASCVLRGIPVIAGQMHWNHMICFLTLRALQGGGYGMEIENSHGESWGNKGIGILTERKAISFDQAAPRVVTAGFVPGSTAV